MSLYGVIGYHVTLSGGHMIANHPIYGVIGYQVFPYMGWLAIMWPSQVVGYHVTLSEGHMIANHPI